MVDTVDPQALAIGRAVLAAMAAAGLSQTAVTKGAGITSSTFARRVRGIVPFTFPELVRIAALCGVKVSDIALAAEHIAARERARSAAAT